METIWKKEEFEFKDMKMKNFYFSYEISAVCEICSQKLFDLEYLILPNHEYINFWKIFFECFIPLAAKIRIYNYD